MEPESHVRHAKHHLYGRILEAAASVSAGGAVCLEAPVVVTGMLEEGAGLSAALSKLTAEQKSLLARLVPEFNGSMKDDYFRQLLQAHSQDFGQDQRALYENISLARHSCEANTVYRSLPGLGMGALFALRDLEAGEMISINRIPQLCIPRAPLWKRRKLLQQSFGFVCQCGRCEAEARAGRQEPSSTSLELLKERESLHKAFADGASDEDFLAMTERYLQHTRSASNADDGTFHLFHGLDLVFEYHRIILESEGHPEEHLLPAISALAEKFTAMPADDDLWDTHGLAALFQVGVLLLHHHGYEQLENLFQRFWARMGGIMYDCCSVQDPASDYRRFSVAFESEPKTRPTATDVVRELSLVRLCSSPSCKLPFVPSCVRFGQEVCGQRVCVACTPTGMCERCVGKSSYALDFNALVAMIVLLVSVVLYQWLQGTSLTNTLLSFFDVRRSEKTASPVRTSHILDETL